MGHGSMSGRGTLSSPDGGQYEGEFARNKFNGSGRKRWKGGKSYDGQWQDSLMHGRGAFSWPDERFYEGDFANNVKEGTGTLRWPDGKAYNGQWKKDKQHGSGTMTHKNGTTKEGVWADGSWVKWVGDNDKESSSKKEAGGKRQ